MWRQFALDTNPSMVSSKIIFVLTLPIKTQCVNQELNESSHAWASLIGTPKTIRPLIQHSLRLYTYPCTYPCTYLDRKAWDWIRSAIWKSYSPIVINHSYQVYYFTLLTLWHLGCVFYVRGTKPNPGSKPRGVSCALIFVKVWIVPPPENP